MGAEDSTRVSRLSAVVAIRHGLGSADPATDRFSTETCKMFELAGRDSVTVGVAGALDDELALK